ncbi:hypothetical protein F441_17516 [Phytophthora nicotianae CJ01A1]|uniref:Uncharacterized protein n=1 Tax=Phytophthora nicotianae CJ01A1 TaxID=1317063 RepID=W2W614_PHYNI|nr:hypothetical protein F441_17516 [Phytophthora nicotianae CJ01A1]
MTACSSLAQQWWGSGRNAIEYLLLKLFLSLVVSESMTHMIIITVTYYISSVVVLGVFMLCE